MEKDYKYIQEATLFIAYDAEIINKYHQEEQFLSEDYMYMIRSYPPEALIDLEIELSKLTKSQMESVCNGDYDGIEISENLDNFLNSIIEQ